MPSDSRPAIAVRVLAAALVLDLALHVITAVITPYGFQRDEFLYFAMGAHLHLWSMDFPPAMAILSQLMRATTGLGLVPVRILPGIASAGLVVFAVLFARELGGRAYAQALAALSIIASPALLRSGTLFQPVVFDQLAWTLVLFALVRLARTGDGRWWLALGAAAGVGLLVKFSIAIIGAGVLVAVLATPERRWLGRLSKASLTSTPVIPTSRCIACRRRLTRLPGVSRVPSTSRHTCASGPCVSRKRCRVGSPRRTRLFCGACSTWTRSSPISRVSMWA